MRFNSGFDYNMGKNGNMTRSFNTVNRDSVSTTGKLTGFINHSGIMNKAINREIGIARSRDIKMSAGMQTQDTMVSPVD